MKKYIYLSAVILSFNFQFKAQNLLNSKWTLVSLDNLEKGSSKLTKGIVESFLTINKDSTYQGSICNYFSGKLKLGEKNSLKMITEGATKKFCLSVTDLEREVFKHFDKANRYKINSGKLFIFTSEGFRITYAEK